jgi:tetratricopeptide (TPR) repeat protein
MKLLLFAVSALFTISVSAQETVIDSAKTIIEKYYNTGLPDSTRASYNSKIAHMDKYIAKDSINPEAYLQRGIYYSFLGLNVEAIEDYNKVLALDDEQPIAYFNRGIAKARFRYTYEACYDFKKSFLLGVNQADKVYTLNCKLYQNKIDSLVSLN